MSMDILGDDVWEYNAPQYVDFAAGEDDPDADAWFDQQNDALNTHSVHENKSCASTPETRRLTRSMCATPQNDKNLPEATEKNKISAQKKKINKPVGSGAASDPLDETKQSDDNSKKIVHSKTKQSQTRSESTPETRGRSRSLKRTNSMRNVNPNPQAHKRRSADPAKTAPVSSVNKPPEKTISNPSIDRAKSMMRRSAGGVPSSTKGPHTRTLSSEGTAHARTRSTSSVPTNSAQNTSQNDTGAQTSKMPKLTIPTTPTFMRRKPLGKAEKVKSSEEQQMEQIANIKAEFNKRKKLAQKSFQTAMKSTGYVPVHSKTEPTKPADFHFETDNRLKSQSSHNTSADKKTDFRRILRSNSRGRSPGPAERVPTKPQPFKLSEGRKRKAETDSETYKSVAEQLMAFHKQTPERFHTQSTKGSERNKRIQSRSPVPGLTVPKTPNFESTSRSRPVHVPSQKELEEKEIEEMKKNQFKAHPVNKRILSNPNTGVKKVVPKPVTKFEEFDLESGKRPHNKSIKADKEEKFEFHAQPAPKKILEGPVGVKPAKSLPLTQPQSPAFALKQRVRLPVAKEEEEEIEKSLSRKRVAHHGVPFQPNLSHKSTVPQPFTFENRDKTRMAQKKAAIDHYFEEENKVAKMIKSHPVPHTGVPFQPILNHKCTVPSPFSFEERDKLAMNRKQEKIEEIFEEEKKMREFHAQPLPVGEDSLPPKKTKPVTIPEPFQLEIDERGVKRMQEFSQKVDEESKCLKSQVNFKANPAKVLQQEPFCPQRSTKPLTDISGFELNTEQRSHKRENFEMHKKAREAEIEAAKRQRERQKEEEEKAAVAKMRAEAVHKSQPIKRYKSMEVLPSDRPLTCAESPKFETDRRLRSKVNCF